MLISKIPLSIYMLALFLLLVIGAKRKKKGEFHEDFLDLEISKSLQGFAAIGVMLHHLSQSVTQYGAVYKGLINFMSEVGIYFTGIFFFFSGYGLYTSFLKKEGYLDNFLRKRLPTVLIPFYVVNTIFFAVSILLGKEMSVPEVFLYASGLILLNGNMWYIVEIIFLYIAFYLIFKNIKKQGAGFALVALFIFVMTTISLFLGHDNQYNAGVWFKGEWWYNTTWIFLIGMLIARYRDKIVGFAKKYYKILLPISMMATVGMYYIFQYIRRCFGYYAEWEGHPGYVEKLITWWGDVWAVIFFIAMLLLLSMKIQFHNRALKFIGSIALELYMIHNIFIMYLKYVIPSDLLFMFSVYGAGIVAAILIRKADRWLIQKW